MEDHDPVAEQINQIARAWESAPLDLSGPVPEEKIAKAEQELGVKFPRSYRIFLRQHGAGTLHHHDIYGLPSDGLWGDIVRMNRIANRPVPRRYLKFTHEIGEYAYYLDTAQMSPECECPVVVFGPGDEGRTVADSFLDFLRKSSEGVV